MKDFSEKINIVIAENQAIRAENQATKAAVLENQFLNKELSEKLVAVVAENQTIKAETKHSKEELNSSSQVVLCLSLALPPLLLLFHSQQRQALYAGRPQVVESTFLFPRWWLQIAFWNTS